jgi:hypothetical protein
VEDKLNKRRHKSNPAAAQGKEGRHTAALLRDKDTEEKLKSLPGGAVSGGKT